MLVQLAALRAKWMDGWAGFISRVALSESGNSGLCSATPFVLSEGQFSSAVLCVLCGLALIRSGRMCSGKKSRKGAKDAKFRG